MDTEAVNEQLDEDQDDEEDHDYEEEIQSSTDAISMQGSVIVEPTTHQMMNNVSNELEHINDVLNFHDGYNLPIEPIAEEVMTSLCINQGMSLQNEASVEEYQEQDETPFLTSEELAVHTSRNEHDEEMISQEITFNPILGDEVSQQESNPEPTSGDERERDEDGETEECDDETPLYPGATKVVLFLLLAFILRHKLSKEGTNDLLYIICPKPNNCCTSVYKFRKIFSYLQIPTKLNYCCSTYLTPINYLATL